MTIHAAVIGGGISGLASAARIAGLGHRVTLFESESFLGGLGTTFPYQGGHLERFYHCILPADAALLRHIAELGLAEDLLWRETRMGFMYRRRIHPLNTPWDLLRFSPLTLTERVRMGLIGLRARTGGMDPALDSITAADWLRRMAGERAFEILWRPLLAAKIGEPYASLPALWLSSRMHREKSTGPERKGCLRHGYRSLIDAFERRLTQHGTQLRLATRIESVERDGDGMALEVAGGERERFDYIVATSPLGAFQRMTHGLGLDPAIANLTLDYQGVVSAVFLTRRPTTPYYWMPFVDSGVTAQGAIAMSNLVPLERAHGLHVTYLVNYTHRDSELFGTGQDELLARYRADLLELFPEAARTIEGQFLFRAPFVEPVWTLNYAARRPPAAVIPGRLYLACTAQVYPRVNSWNSCCEGVDAMMPQLAAETAAAHAARRSVCA
jgi:protoporphyrinogen oxidase